MRRFVCFVCISFLTMMGTEQLSLAQIKNRKPVLGDIIRYEGFNELRYGMIVEFTGAGGAWVEYVDDRGKFRRDLLMSREEWVYVVQVKKPTQSGIRHRVWSTPDGKFKIAARMIDADDLEVTLEKKETGKNLKVEIFKLSKRDRDYIKRNRSKIVKQDDEEPETPIEDFPEEVQMLIARRDKLIERDNASMAMSRSAAKAKNIRLKTSTFSVLPGRFQPLMNGESLETFVDIPDATFHTGVDGMAFARESGIIAMVTGTAFEGKTILSVFHLDGSGELLQTDELAANSRMLAISPSGKTMILQSKSKRHFDGALELWRNELGVLEQISSVPMKASNPQVVLLSDQEGAILNRGKLGFFNVTDKIEPTYIAQPSDGSQLENKIQVSDDGRLLFVFGDRSNAIYAVDLTTKKCVGGLRFESESGLTNSVCLAASGTEVVVVNDKVLKAYDLKTGKPTEEYEIEAGLLKGLSLGRESLVWLGDGLIIVGDKIVDAKRQLEIGEVVNHDRFSRNSSLFGWSRIYCEMNRSGSGSDVFGGASPEPGSRQSTRSVSVQLNQLEVQDIMRHRTGITEQDIVKLKNGDSIKLTMDLGPEKRSESRIRKQIADDLSAKGIRLSPSSDFVLHVKYTVGKPQTQKYRIIGFGTDRFRTVTSTPKSCSAVLTYKGEKIWSRGRGVGHGRPFSEDDLDRNLKDQSSFSVNNLTEIDYPGSVRALPPSKRLKIRW